MVFSAQIRFLIFVVLAFASSPGRGVDALAPECSDGGIDRLDPAHSSGDVSKRSSVSGDPSAALDKNPAKKKTPSANAGESNPAPRRAGAQQLPSYSGVGKLKKQPAGMLPTPLTPIASKLPPAHNEARMRAAEANREILRTRSSDFKSKLRKLSSYSKARLYDSVIVGAGPHGSAAEYGLGAASSNRARVAILNRGEVASPEVFGPVNPRDSHMTANPATVKGFPDNVAPGRSTMTLTDSVRAPDGTYPESSAVALHVENNLARSPADLMFGVNNEQVIPRELVELAKRVVAEGKVSPIDPEMLRLAQEPLENWPPQAKFMVLTKDIKTQRTERLFAVNLVNASGLGPPRNPFPKNSPEWALANVALQRANPVNGPPAPDKAKPKVANELIHEAAALLRVSEGRIDTLHDSGPVVAYGSGPSAIVAMGRFLERNPNPDKPLQVLTRGPLDPIADSPTLEALRSNNSDLYIVGVKNVAVGKPVNGQVEVTLTDRNGDLFQFTAPADRLRVTVERGTDGKEMNSQIVSVDSVKPRVQHTQIDPDTLKLTPTEGDPPSLAISFKPVGSDTTQAVNGQLIVAVGQDNTNHHNAQFGPNVVADEKKVFADVNFGYDPAQGSVNVAVARQTQGLRVQVGMQNGVPQFEDIGVSGGFYAVGPGARRGSDALVDPKISKSPNPSVDSLANTVSATEVLGARLYNPVNAVPNEPVRLTEGKTWLGPVRREGSLPTKSSFTLAPVNPPAHLKDLTAIDAPSRKILSEGLLSEAGRVFQRFAVAGGADEATNRIEINFERDPKTGAIEVKFIGAEGSATAKSHLEAAIRSDERFASQLDAYMRSNQPKLQMWLGFDRAGNFRPDLVRVSSPMDALASHYLENRDFGAAAGFLPRVVEVGVQGITPAMIEANYRQLYEAPAASVKVSVDPVRVDSVSGKRFYKVYREDPATKQMKLDVVLVEYSHDDREIGVRNIAGAKYLQDRRLGATLANRPERAAEATVGRKDAATPKKVLMVVQKVVATGGTLDEDVGAFKTPQLPTQVARELVRYHTTPSGAEKAFSDPALSYIAEEGSEAPVSQRAAVTAFLQSDRWQSKVAHGDPRLVHLVPDGDQVRLAGVGNAIDEKHPIEDLRILVSDLNSRPQTRGSITPIIDTYIRESLFTPAEATVLRSLVTRWSAEQGPQPPAPAARARERETQPQR